MKPHPAKYNDKFIPIFAEMLEDCKTILDPFAGTGKIFELNKYGNYNIYGIEIEPEWANNICGDALYLPFDSNSFDGIVTSPTYSNRMADHHVAKDTSKRITYTHCLGRNLSPNNSGKMQWGDEYRQFHINAWKECKRVLKTNGKFIINIKDHIRKGVVQEVSEWHFQTLINLGFELLISRKIDVKGNGFGANNEIRLSYEYITLFKKL